MYILVVILVFTIYLVVDGWFSKRLRQHVRSRLIQKIEREFSSFQNVSFNDAKNDELIRFNRSQLRMSGGMTSSMINQFYCKAELLQHSNIKIIWIDARYVFCFVVHFEVLE